MGRPSLNPIADSRNFVGDFSADGAPANPVLFETGDWRLYGHIDDPYSTMAHKCPKWAKDGNWGGGGDEATQWRWYWGKGPCGKCHDTAPDDILTLFTLHNFDRMAVLK